MAGTSQHWLQLQPGEQARIERDLKDTKPFAISMADGVCKSVCSQVLTVGRIVIGHATHEMSCLIVDKLAVDYLIGFAWQLMYDLQLKPKNAVISLGVTHES